MLLPAFLQGLGADLLLVGIIMGTTSVSGIAVRPWVGMALDDVGRKKCLLAGGVVFIATNLLYLQVNTIGVFIYGVRLLHGLSMGILMASFFTLAADLSPEDRRTEGIALFGVSGHLSAAIGVMIGEGMVRFGGYGGLFWACAGFALSSVLLSSRISEPGHREQGGSREGFFRLAGRPQLRLPLVATVGFSISLSSYMVFL